MATISSQMVLSGLGTFTTSVEVTGLYDISGSLSLPEISKGDPASSQVVSTIKKNGSTIFTSSAGAAGFQIKNYPFTAADTVTVQLTSAAAVDQGINVIKCTVAIG
jgi:hypothetical protein